MSNNKQSSVEWYINNLIDILGDEICNKLTIEQTNRIHFLGEQAKEMHKKEIEESYSEGQSEGSNRASSFDWGVRIKEVTAQQYYNETFKQQ